VHHQGACEADVTEGSNGIWERLHYDWSNPQRVVMTTTDSNLWGSGSGHTYTFTRRPDGTTDVDAVVVREGKNFKGQVLGFVLGTIGRRVLERAFENSVKAIEARKPRGQRRCIMNADYSPPRTSNTKVQVKAFLRPAEPVMRRRCFWQCLPAVIRSSGGALPTC
jgi:hypothetical protein